MEQVCISSGAEIAGVIGMVVAGVSTIVNFIPAPDKIKNPVLKFVSKLLHFIAVDIVTAVKK